MSLIFILKKESPKETQIFHFLKGYFVMGDPIDTKLGAFWETLVNFLNIAILNVNSRPKLHIP